MEDDEMSGPERPAFPSSVNAFYPSQSALSEYPLFASRRSQGPAGQAGPSQVPSQMSLNLSGPAYATPTGPSGLGPAFLGSKLRRQSFLASNADDYADDAGGGYDSPNFADAEMESAMSFGLNEADTRPTSSSGNSQYAKSVTQSRARSMSQSTNITNRSPPWPSSPPRSSQYMLSRMTSEQQQALQATATSASNAMYMIPSSFRNAAQRDDVIVAGQEDEPAQEEDDEDGNFVDMVAGQSERRPSTVQSRSFNPLNPRQLRNSPALSNDGMEGADRYTSPRQRQQIEEGLSMERTMSGDSSMSSQLRPSRSSPSLSALNEQSGSQVTAPRTPPQADVSAFAQQQPLRRSHSATHRLSGFSAFAKPDGANIGFMSVPQTAPIDGSLRVMRANSFSGLSAASLRANSAPRSADRPSYQGFPSSSSITAEAMDERLAASRTRRAYGNGMEDDADSNKAARNPSHSSGSESGLPMQPRVVKRVVNHKKGSLMVSGPETSVCFQC